MATIEHMPVPEVPAAEEILVVDPADLEEINQKFDEIIAAHEAAVRGDDDDDKPKPKTKGPGGGDPYSSRLG